MQLTKGQLLEVEHPNMGRVWCMVKSIKNDKAMVVPCSKGKPWEGYFVLAKGEPKYVGEVSTDKIITK